MKLQLPPGLTTNSFLRDYWQRRPLLIRNALPADRLCPLTAEELAGLACEEEIESRIVLEKHGKGPWEARHGPFTPDSFAQLPDSHWTLLLQDLDKHIPELGELLTAFDFIPDWRLDDIMISYAVDQGSVGPHIDDYDVFLLQARGERRWQINTRQCSEADYIPGIDLRILPDFEAEHEWLLTPGDLLYLPPKVAHWGIAEGDDCITCSVGYQAPGLKEMATAWCSELIEMQVPDGRYRDPGLPLQTHRGEITDWSMQRMAQLLEGFLRQDPAARQRWFGRFVTETKAHLQVEPVDQPLTTQEFLQRLRQQGTLARNLWSRMAFCRGAAEDYLFICGEEFAVNKADAGLLEQLTEQRHFDYASLQEWLQRPDALRLLTQLYNEGHLCFADD